MPNVVISTIEEFKTSKLYRQVNQLFINVSKPIIGVDITNNILYDFLKNNKVNCIYIYNFNSPIYNLIFNDVAVFRK